MTAPILILGAHGQVGRALQAHFANVGIETVGFGSRDLDICDGTAVRALYARYPSSTLINAGAYTAVDAAEADAMAAYRVNGVGPALLSSVFGHDAPLIHYSTDYVFDGTAQAPIPETATIAPLGVYGQSKALGEEAVLSAPLGTVIRTAWVYGPTGKNFLKTMIKVGRERGALRVVDDQIGTPTHGDDIALGSHRILAALGESGRAGAGIYHLTAAGQTSWHGFAGAIFAALKAQTGEEVALTPIPSAEYPTPAPRPAYSVLDCSRYDRLDGPARRAWAAPVEATVARVLEEMKGS